MTGLKSKQVRALERLYRRKIPPRELIHLDLGREMAAISAEISRQIGLLVDRQGVVRNVIVGDARGIEIPDLGRARAGTSRLRGLRCIHTHLKPSPLSQEDLTDLALLRLDAMAAIEALGEGETGRVHVAYLLPASADEESAGEAPETMRGGDEETPPWEQSVYPDLGRLDLDISALISSLEEEFSRHQRRSTEFEKGERALLALVDTGERSGRSAEAELSELEALAKGSGLIPCGKVVQRRKRADPRFVIGRGRLAEVLMRSMQTGAEALVFAQELSPAQVRSLADFTDLKILDRTQIILDIFAQRASSRLGKLQVELAQLRYMLPRLSAKHTAMSRLTGGIGGRGPGETKLEVSRRRANERIRRLERELDQLQRKRSQGRRLRSRREVPILSLVGYTNAGKSTLLNALTKSEAFVADQLFATLDTSSRRLRLPRDQEVLITDTVGFIHDLPKELLGAFKSTLEELGEADLLLHVIDASDPECDGKIEAVEELLRELGLEDTPVLRVFNKMDKADDIQIANLCRRYDGVSVSGIDPKTLVALIEEASARLGKIKRTEEKAGLKWAAL
ncbi:MAG: GTPase HflX [bacterium]